MSVFHSEKYGVCVCDSEVKVLQRLLYLEITDWESVNIFTVQLRGAVMRAERIATNSALNEQGQSFIWAWNV
jgi:hypothetical protein